MLRAIFFDIDDTLYSTSEFSEIARANAVNAMIEVGLSLPREQLTVELDEVIREFSSNYEHHFDKLLLRIPRRFYKGVNPAVIVAAGIIAYHETKVRQLAPYEDAIEVGAWFFRRTYQSGYEWDANTPRETYEGILLDQYCGP